MASGTIPQVSNNSGAGYCKMPDGTLIQWGTVTATFKNGVCAQPISFPIAFASIPVVSASIMSSDSIYATATAINCAATNANIFMYMPANPTYGGTSGGGGNIMWTAIGRWK